MSDSTLIPRFVWHLGLSPFDLWLYATICRIEQQKSVCQITLRELAREATMSVGSAKNSHDRLLCLGIIDRVFGVSSKPNFVYAIHAEPDYYKIGCTEDPPIRIASLRSMSPVPIKAKRVSRVRDGMQFKKMLHNKFAHRRDHGEWFRLTRDEADKLFAILDEESRRFVL